MRDLTEIEEQILETVVRLIVQDLRTTWAPVIELDFQFEQRQSDVQVQSTMVPEDKILCLSFEGHLSNASGSITLAFPAVIADALLRRLSAQSSYAKRMPSREVRRRVRERLLTSKPTHQPAGCPAPGRSRTRLGSHAVQKHPRTHSPEHRR
jgi:flagellar motor switch protein FliM